MKKKILDALAWTGLVIGIASILLTTVFFLFVMPWLAYGWTIGIVPLIITAILIWTGWSLSRVFTDFGEE